MVDYSPKKVILTILPFALILIILRFILLNALVPSASMEPTINTNTYVLCNRLAYYKNEPQRGDVIIFTKDDKQFCKRIIGLAGDIIEIDAEKNQLIVNGYVAYEEYVKDDITYAMSQTFEVPEDCYFVMGDNRDDSNDSRVWIEPYVKKEDIEAKVFLNYSFGDLSLHAIKEYTSDYQDF